MDDYDDEPHTPDRDPDSETMLPSEDSPWGFHDAREQGEEERAVHPTRISRHSSLPRSLFGGRKGSPSGSVYEWRGPPPRQEEQRPPLLSLTQPSQESVPVTQPPLSTLAATASRNDDEVRATVDRRRLPRVEKDADDPTTPAVATRDHMARQQSTTLTTLSRLFAVQAPTSPISRHSSYLQTTQPTTAPYTRNLVTTTVADLPHHLFNRGLLEGRHSDITVHAFGHQYKLHRLILDRAPFFTSALSTPWLEANAKEITVHPSDLDSSITQSAFELALKRLYGCGNPLEEDLDAIGLFATGCWLEMQDLISSSIESMLRQMTPETLSPLVKLVTTNYYGRAGDKILASAKAMLCRDGWRMPLKNWDGIPGDIIREIVGGDGFFIDGEFDRWVLAKRILDRRLKARAIEAGLTQPGNRRKVRKAPDAVNLMAIRFDGVYRKTSSSNSSFHRGVPDALYQWITLYTHPDVEPVLVLLDEGIHYIHLDFEQLQFIRRARDILGLPVLPGKVISNALWQQMELRQRVVNAREADMELDLSVRCTDDHARGGVVGRDTTMSITTPSEPPKSATTSSGGKGKEKSSSGKHRSSGASMPNEEADEDLDSGSWDGNGKPRKFWIPSSDCNIVMGGNADPVIATSLNNNHARHAQNAANRLSATIQPEDLQWASDFASISAQAGRPGSMNSDGGRGAVVGETAEVRFSYTPPFRFAVEFPNPRVLKEKRRYYSRTVFYAGSLWNIYIQKVATARSKQLGVYLHRAKEREAEEVPAGVTRGVGGVGGVGVAERTGELERVMEMRRQRRERRRVARRRTVGEVGDGGVSEGSVGSVGGVGGETAAGLIGAAGGVRASTMRALLARGRSRGGSGEFDFGAAAASAGASSSSVGAGSAAAAAFASSSSEHQLDGRGHDEHEGDVQYSDVHDDYDNDDGEGSASDSDDSDFASNSSTDSEAEQQTAANPTPNAPPPMGISSLRTFNTPTLPPYVDARPTIRTYFKIYSPSRGGRMLSVFESAPDKFNFSQSWGWKSSSLMLDEGALLDLGEGQEGGGSDGEGKVGGEGKESGSGKLRFMVVIGNT